MGNHGTCDSSVEACVDCEEAIHLGCISVQLAVPSGDTAEKYAEHYALFHCQLSVGGKTQNIKTRIRTALLQACIPNLPANLVMPTVSSLLTLPFKQLQCLNLQISRSLAAFGQNTNFFQTAL